MNHVIWIVIDFATRLLLGHAWRQLKRWNRKPRVQHIPEPPVPWVGYDDSANLAALVAIRQHRSQWAAAAAQTASYETFLFA
jgi:hypothetical protein